MQVDFYRLTTLPLDRALPRVAERVVEGRGRLLIVTADGAQRESLDRLLWAYAPDSFLPHAQAGDNDAAQPVLISPDITATNGARHIALVDGVWRDGSLAFERVFHFFGDDALPAARVAWKALADRPGVERRYWQQDEAGRWAQAG